MISEGDVVCAACGGINEHLLGCSSQTDQEFTIISAYSRNRIIRGRPFWSRL
jgi:hypothetical protein